MNYYDANTIMGRIRSGEQVSPDVYREARAFLDGGNETRPSKPKQPSPLSVRDFASPMDAPCTCGLRYGQHRVGDYRCPNQEWKPGNGQPQWKTAVFRRSA